MLNQKLVSILLRPKSVARGKASISATTLTVTGFAAESSMFEVGMNITGAGVFPSTWILARVSGKGGEGTYTVSVRQNVAETEIKGEFCYASQRLLPVWRALLEQRRPQVTFGVVSARFTL